MDIKIVENTQTNEKMLYKFKDNVALLITKDIEVVEFFLSQQQEIERLKEDKRDLKEQIGYLNGDVINLKGMVKKLTRSCSNCKYNTDTHFYSEDENCRGDSCKDENYYAWEPQEDK